MARLKAAGTPTAKMRFLTVLGPRARGMLYIRGIDFANVAIPAQRPL